jgi:hydrogenase/urease accessory protein HupE
VSTDAKRARPTLYPTLYWVVWFASWLCLPARAHTVSLTYAEVNVEENQILWTLRLPVAELDLLLNADKNHDGAIGEEEYRAAKQDIDAYILAHVSVRSQGRLLPAIVSGGVPWKGPDGHMFLELHVRFGPVAGALGRVTLRCDILRDVVSTHRTLARIEVGGETREFVFENGRDFEVDAHRSWFASFLQFARMGVFHIFTGYDHIAFLLGVVLVGGSFKTIVKAVTAFTVAHSITLALAALNIVLLPSRIVESGIALSIMYIALENIFFRQFDRRWIITFLFGLVHGFGFASALAEVHLSGRLLGTALFAFNLGVETGQICIVGILLPLLALARRTRFNLQFVRTCSAFIFVMGFYWFLQRISGH